MEQYNVTVVVTQEQASFLAHTLAMLAFDAQKQAAFWEGMGDSKTNSQKLEEQAFLAGLANTFAIAHWSEEKKSIYNFEEELENV